jgi:hypothetical protein
MFQQIEGAVVRAIVKLLGAAPSLLICAQLAAAQTCTPTNYSASDIAAAVAASPYANSILKNSSCTWGGAGRSESGGNLCASNGNNFGVLQLNRSNLPPGVTPATYESEPLQQQVDTWAAQVGNSNTSSTGYQTLASAQASGQSIGNTPVTSGMLAACFQFGPAICNNDVAALQAGQPCGGANPININSVPRNPSQATTDGNGQTICSWGGNIQANINSAAATCKNGTGDCAPSNLTDFPTPPPAAPTDIVVS